MQHKLKNIDVSSVTIGSLVLTPNSTIVIFDTVTYETNYVSDITTSLTSSAGINKHWSDGKLEYYQDSTLKTQSDFYTFINTFLSETYPKITNSRNLVSPSINLSNKSDLSGSTFTGNISAPTVTATTLYSGSTLVDSLFARTSHTHVVTDVSGLQSSLATKANFSGATFTGNVVVPAFTATTISSGTTLIDSLFARTNHTHVVTDVSGLQSSLATKSNLSGATFTGAVIVPNFTATTISSGTTLIDSLFARTNHTHSVADITDLSGPLGTKANLSGATFTGNISAPIVTATTLYSGATLIDSLFARTNHTHIISDITGLQSSLATKADLSGSTFTGNVVVPAFTATTISSGSTNLYSIFAPIGSIGGGSFTGGTVAGATVFTGGLTANTIFSGTTDLYAIFARFGQTAQIFTGTTNVNFGNNNRLESFFATTAVTNSNVTNNSVITFTILNSTDHPSAEESLIEGITLKESDVVNGSGFTLNAYAPNGTWGNYDVYYKIVNLVFSGQSIYNVSDINGLQSSLATKADLSGATFTGNVVVPNFTATTISSGSTNLYSIFAPIGSIGGGSFTGGTVAGATVFTGGLTANTISATTITGVTIISNTYKNSLGNTHLNFQNVGNANYFDIYNATSGGGPKMIAAGSDSNINFHIESKGTGYVYFSTNTAIRTSEGTTAQRPTAGTGMIRYNSTLSLFEGYENGAWVDLSNLQYIQFSLLSQLNNSTTAFWYGKDEGGVTGGYRSADSNNGISTNATDPWLCPFDGRIIGVVFFAKGLGVPSGTPTGPYTYRADIYNMNSSAAPNVLTTVNISIPNGTTIGAFNSSVNTYITVEQALPTPITFTKGQNLGIYWVPVTSPANSSISIQEGVRITLIVQKTL